VVHKRLPDSYGILLASDATGASCGVTPRGRKMSRKSIGILLGIYFLSALAFAFFRVFSNPFFARLDALTFAEAIGGALLLFLGAGLLPLLGWALYRFSPEYTWRMLASWAFIGIAMAYFFEVGARLERDVQVTMLSKSLILSGSKLSCLDSEHASKFRSQVGITEREISLYCGCVSEALAASITSDELTYIATNGRAPQVIQERAAEMARPCRTLVGRTKM
jgi:hypothetical protein